MSAEHNRWIISRRKFREHKTFKSVECELKRLEAACPGVEFNVYRIKRVVEPEGQSDDAADQRSAASPPPAVSDHEARGAI